MFKIFTALTGSRPPCRLYKSVLMMKLTFIFLTATLLQASAGTYAQVVTIKVEQATLKEVFERIQHQTRYDFLYNAEDLKTAKSVSINLNRATLKQVLDACFRNQSLTYTVDNTTILVNKKKTVPDVKNNLYANIGTEENYSSERTESNNKKAEPVYETKKDFSKPVTGKIIDSKGQPVQGVTVTEKETQNIVASDGNGNYSINVAGDNATLVYSIVGYATQEVAVTGRTAINITLQVNATSLNDVVVVGYGTQRRGDVTGAISTINEKTLREVPVTNPQQLLQGRVAGAYVTQSSNRPGAEPSVLLRGHRSITASNNPLYVIDGIPTNDGLSDINPNDIVSIDVLKDASATAIYGSRGANGVIIITTARGRERKDGQPDVHYDTYVGKTKINRYVDVLSGPKYVQFRRDAYATNGVTDDAKIFSTAELAAIAANQYTDWQKVQTREGFQQNHELSILGASKTTRYNISLGYYKDKGYIPLTDYTRYNMRVNLDQDIGKQIKMGVSMLASYVERNGGSYNPIPAAVVQNPIGSPYDVTGNLLPFPSGDPLMYNPLSNYIPGNLISLEKRTRILSSIYAEAKIWDGLKFRVNFGPDLTNSRSGNYTASNTTGRAGASPTASTSNEYVFSYTLENILSYNKTFGKHKIDFTGLYSIQQRISQTGSASVQDLPVSTTTYENLGSANTITGVSSNYLRYDILSYMARINYVFDSRFLLTLTGRTDGTSVFPPGNKWSFFPSAAVAYNMINENYIRNLAFISNLKLRLSYGHTGNQAVSSYGTLAVLNRSYYDFNDVAALGYYPGTIPNSQLRWETTASTNLGLDFGFLHDRIAGTLEGYYAHTFNLLLPYALPSSTGFQSVVSNVGNTRNRGVELTLSTRNIVSKNNSFEWSTDLTGAFNKEEVIATSAGKVNDIGSLLFIGKPVSVNYDYTKTGIWQLGDTHAAQYSSATGQIKVADLNGNGKIDQDDRSVLGSPTPKYTFGINNRFSYRNFDIGVFMQGVAVNQIVSAYYNPPNNSIAFGGRYNIVNVNYWTPTNPTDEYPRPISGTAGSPGVLFGSTLRYFNGSYLRVRNIDVGYSLPRELVSRIRAQSIRIYADVTNPYTLSPYVQKYHGTNPEITDTPSTINYLLGLNVRF